MLKNSLKKVSIISIVKWLIEIEKHCQKARNLTISGRM
jgi:hypothetical protein